MRSRWRGNPGPARRTGALNSERIAAAFGSYGVEVLEQDEQVPRLEPLQGPGRTWTCRTFAIVRYPPHLEGAVSAEHAEIVAGGSIGAVFAAHGWQVRKTHLSYAERPASARLAELMRVAVGTTLAEHIYELDVVKDGRSIEYAALAEIHHPDYLSLADLARIYGPLDDGRKELVAQLRATVAERTR